jgi:hypothetical protein
MRHPKNTQFTHITRLANVCTSIYNKPLYKVIFKLFIKLLSCFDYIIFYNKPIFYNCYIIKFKTKKIIQQLGHMRCGPKKNKIGKTKPKKNGASKKNKK